MKILHRDMTKVIVTLLSASAAIFSVSAFAIKSVSAYALFNDKAILVIDGQKRMLKAGDTSKEGLTLVSSTTKSAVVRIDGKEETIGLTINPTTEDMSIGSGSTAIGETVTLNMDGRGFFHAEGEINGQSVTFLVDTGANSVAMNFTTARQLDIDFESGRPSIASTANGLTSMFVVTLDKVSIGPIDVDNVQASIIQDPRPAEILLGMSFLRNLEMNRVGSTMELIQR